MHSRLIPGSFVSRFCLSKMTDDCCASGGRNLNAVPSLPDAAVVQAELADIAGGVGGTGGADIGGVVALVGSPNCGKTTLFNWLTGSRFKTVNYPGATVDYSIGSSHSRFGPAISVMDTPGTYSLDPKSPDEWVTLNAIFRHPSFGTARLIVSVVDATQLSRQMLVTRQLLSSGFRVVTAVTMSDLLSERGEELDVQALSRALNSSVVLIDGRLGGGISELIGVIGEELKKINQLDLNNRPSPVIPGSWNAERLQTTMEETSQLAGQVIRASIHPRAVSTAAERTRKIDAVLLHPVWGLIIFVLIMGILFTSIFWVAKPVMDAVDFAFTFFGEHVLRLAPENLLIQFFVNGVVASAAAVFVFVPQIFILFVGIILLEDSGYLARSATLVDRPLSMLGMGGRSFVPLLSGYACAVPAMMAARTINSKRERWLTLFILPLMSCSARVPVYTLLLTFLFYGSAAWKAGVTLAGIYFASLIVGGIAALIASRFLPKKDASFFMMELPVYRLPKASLVGRQAFSRTRNYAKRAGPAIFVCALLVWGATTFPAIQLQDRTERLNASYAAQVGRWIEPVFKPMGTDWRVGVGLISAFAAREVFVSSLAIVFQVTDDNDATMQDTLLKKMHDAQAPDGRPLFTFASVIGLVIFFMIALQCLSTVMVSVRESGQWRFAILQLVLFNVVGYLLAVAAVQGLRSVGIS